MKQSFTKFVVVPSAISLVVMLLIMFASSFLWVGYYDSLSEEATVAVASYWSEFNIVFARMTAITPALIFLFLFVGWHTSVKETDESTSDQT